MSGVAPGRVDRDANAQGSIGCLRAGDDLFHAVRRLAVFLRTELSRAGPDELEICENADQQTCRGLGVAAGFDDRRVRIAQLQAETWLLQA